MSENEIRSLRVALGINATLFIYALNRDTMTPEEAAKEAVKLVGEMDVENVYSILNEGV